MPIFDKSEEELQTDVDRWLFLLKNLSKLNKIPALLNKRIFQKLFSIAEVSRLNKEERMMYEASLKAKLSDSDLLRANESIPFAKWDYENTIKYAEFQAEARGKAEGKAEGAHEKAVAIAREMKKEGVPIYQIQKFTDLSEEEIKNL